MRGQARTGSIDIKEWLNKLAIVERSWRREERHGERCCTSLQVKFWSGRSFPDHGNVHKSHHWKGFVLLEKDEAIPAR